VPGGCVEPADLERAGPNSASGNDVVAVSAVLALPRVAAFIVVQEYVVAGLTAGSTQR
jgi:multiple sugar transport system permease protein